MYYSGITKESHMEGPGLRVVLWCSGCNHRCPGCQNPETHNPANGKPFLYEQMTELISYLDNPYIQGLTFCGGDPLYPSNIDMVTLIAQTVKRRFPDKDILLYTGDLWENIKDLEVMDYVDMVIDGPFKQELLDVNYPYAGSTNQRRIDVRKTKKSNSIIEWR